MHLDVYYMDFIQTWSWYVDRYYYSCTVHFDTRLIDLGHDSRSQKCEKANTSAAIISQTFQLIWMEFGVQLRLVGVMNLILVLSCPLSIQGRQPYLCDFVKMKVRIGLYSDIKFDLNGIWCTNYNWDLLVWWTSYLFCLVHPSCPFNIQGTKPDMWFRLKKKSALAYIHTFTLIMDWFLSNLYDDKHDKARATFWYQFGWHWFSFKVTVVTEIKNFGVHFLANLRIDLDKISRLPHPLCWRSC